MISEADRDNIHAHKLQLMSNMPCSAFNQMRYSFCHKPDLDSLYITNRRHAHLIGVTPVLIDCCVNSYIAYTRKYVNYAHCPYCGESRWSNQKLGASSPIYHWDHDCKAFPRILKRYTNWVIMHDLFHRLMVF